LVLLWQDESDMPVTHLQIIHLITNTGLSMLKRRLVFFFLFPMFVRAGMFGDYAK